MDVRVLLIVAMFFVVVVRVLWVPAVVVVVGCQGVLWSLRCCEWL